MIDSTTSANSPSVSCIKSNKYLGGNSEEIEATLEACLRVHRWDRAMTLLEQLRAIHDGDVAELQRVYNKVLEAIVFDHIWNRSQENIHRINGWVENDMKKAAVIPNAETFALKIKAAMSTLDGRRRLRTVRRYWDMAKRYNIDWEVASKREILSDSDLGKLSEISPLEHEVDTVDDGILDDSFAVQQDVVAEAALPSVRETEQKGLGLPSLRKSLSVLNDPAQLADWENAKQADLDVRQQLAQQRQIQLERDSLSAASERWRIEHEQLSKLGISGDLSRGKLGSMLWAWHEKMIDAIQVELEQVQEAESFEGSRIPKEKRLRTEYGPFLRLLPPRTLAALTATTTITLMNKCGAGKPVRLSNIVIGVGKTIEQEIEFEYKKQLEQLRRLRKRVNLDSSSGSPTKQLPAPPRHVHWSLAQHAKVGSILCELLFKAADVNVPRTAVDGGTVTASLPAFDRHTQLANGKSTNVVSFSPQFASMLSTEPVADLLAKQLPMICEPKPWTGFETGGYLESKNPVLRVKNFDAAQKQYTEAAAKRGDLEQLFKGLDVLGKTGWRINEDVYRVMLDAWNSGEAIANLPKLDKGENIALPELPEGASGRERHNHYKAIQAKKNEKMGRHSNRCFLNFQMEIARSMMKEAFYLPHNVDFRGRAYPIPPYLNQMGADNARGLLLFAKGKQLGSVGFRWLKVHLANVCGYDKASLADRAEYADAHIDDIRDSVENPLTGRRWWLQAEDPWQCLATAHELVRAIDSGNPETFVSHLPVHQDGTCNGLQHYAALGGDIAGARQVNLEPGDRPADVYTGVAELVKAEVIQDAEAGDTLAKELDGRITRKIVKQTVMTNVYGVTFVGARLQVRKQLDDLLPDLKEKKLASKASSYIARKIFKGLGTLFNAAHEIQYWFGDCANRISSSISPTQLASMSSKPKTTISDKRKLRTLDLSHRTSMEPQDFRSSVIWTTPLKLPVVQPYRISKARTVATHMAQIMISEPNVADCVDKRKQLQSFPPNFVHSLDATHMMLSAIDAYDKGLTFSAVHDSFWTHAADIDSLNSVIREQFVRMHTEDIVGRLSEEFKLRYKGHIYLAKVERKSPLGKQILEWREQTKHKHVSTSTKKGKINAAEKTRQFWELQQEHKRQKLLASTDPDERAEGLRLVTPASLLEKIDGEKYLVQRTSLGETAIGHIPESQQEADSAAVEAALDNDEIEELHDVDMASTLEPVLDVANNDKPKDKTSKKASHGALWLWLPLTFKPTPKKGDWDIRRLKESTYFFS